ncbi:MULTISPECIES: FKBP-type peptidyl-prolyl cis-trans isomerase [Actinomadura]|uniref:Peptidyl-prolyl cis-trans isomerase n=1 Tax=Actinomadura litoris TaxID=2678616 RepID=A0A7K1LBF5_9ACTN|nr:MULTISPECIES: FKBP-type peptidyl-prolyl cis-trans isomerase [Actinomadura]MBT2209785.1 FKBP-type peptidyl-prolyl cis-trans isomerase [Actinomadura sp. NEAU-AAG7]MUN41758.1 FKBP-type peptidyl-prolyl cis-trans isomerase [Actinomadura litoris]
MALERPEIDFPEGQPPEHLDITDITKGDGDEAVKGATVSMHYVGVSWSTGEEFDASWNRGGTFDFQLGAGRVIKGWDMGIAGMKVGGRRKLVIPPHLAYGDRSPSPAIKPGETLIFVVDLLEVK